MSTLSLDSATELEYYETKAFTRVSKNKVYKTHKFSLESIRAIRTLEITKCLEPDTKMVRLFDEDLVLKLKKRYSYLHIGLVQIALHPLFSTRRGLEKICIPIALRDGRDPDSGTCWFHVLTSLCEGPVYFNCNPNFSLLLEDPRVLDVLTLDIDSSGYEMKPGCHHAALTYRVYYKVMNTNNPKAKTFQSLYKTDVSKCNVVPKRAINFPETSTLRGVAGPGPAQGPVEQTPQGDDEDEMNAAKLVKVSTYS